MDNWTKIIIIGILAFVLYNLCTKEETPAPAPVAVKQATVEKFVDKNRYDMENVTPQVYPFPAPDMNPITNPEKITTPAPDAPVDLMDYSVEPAQKIVPVSPSNAFVASDKLTAEDLLPKDNNSVFAQLVPTTGSLEGVNLIEAGYHIGVNTVGQSLKNANYQIRSDPPCPKFNVGPFINSTIDYDSNRRPFEIGSS